MNTPRPPQPPVMRLIEQKRKRLGYSFKTAGSLAEMSDTRWRQLETGSRTFKGVTVEETANPHALARMARAVRLTPDDLREAGHEEAAEILADLIDANADAEAGDARNAARAAAALDGLTADQRERLAGMIAEDLRKLRDE